MKKIILTGFGPFGPYQFNPTKDLVEFYNGKRIHDADIIGLELPCTYYEGFDVLSKAIKEIHPDIIINVGLSSSITKIRIETKFRNCMNGKYPDSEGYMPRNVQIDKGFSIGKTISTRDNSYIEQILNSNGVPFEVSENAEAFFCNSLGWLMTHALSEVPLSHIKNVFIHIPWTDDYESQINLDPGKIFLKKGLIYKTVDLLIQHM